MRVRRRHRAACSRRPGGRRAFPHRFSVRHRARRRGRPFPAARPRVRPALSNSPRARRQLRQAEVPGPADTGFPRGRSLGERSANLKNCMMNSPSVPVASLAFAGGWTTQMLPELSQSELIRYSRHLTLSEIGVAGQRRLKSARVLCVGAGGLGSPAAMYLAAAGVGTIGLVDFDAVDVTNLHRQLLYSVDDVGRPKLEAAAERLRGLNPDLERSRASGHARCVERAAAGVWIRSGAGRHR